MIANVTEDFYVKNVSRKYILDWQRHGTAKFDLKSLQSVETV